jgi:hypothetical protein
LQKAAMVETRIEEALPMKHIVALALIITIGVIVALAIAYDIHLQP